MMAFRARITFSDYTKTAKHVTSYGVFTDLYIPLQSLYCKYIVKNQTKTRIGVFAQGQILCISPNGL